MSPIQQGKSKSFCLLQVILEHGELYGIRLRPILRDSLEHDFGMESIMFTFPMNTLAINPSNQKEA